MITPTYSPTHLPGQRDFDASAAVATFDAPMRPLPGTPLVVPELEAASVRTIWKRMLDARRAWMSVPLGQRCERLAQLSQRLLHEGPGDDAQILARSTRLSPAGLQAAWDVTLRPWTHAALEGLLQAESWGAAEAADEDRIPARLLHVLAGNVLPPTWSLLVRGWLLGAAQWLRPSSREPLFAASILRRVAAHEPLLAAMTTVTWWPHADDRLDAMARAVCESSQVVTVHGDDSSVEAVQQALADCDPRPQCVGFGSRWSAVLIGLEGLSTETAQAIARDVALFDQQGCLSPTHVFVPPTADLEACCDALANALRQLETQLPSGNPGRRARLALRHWRESMRLQLARGRVRHVRTAEADGEWCVVGTDALQAWRSPLDRHMLVQPVRDANELAHVFGAELQRLQGLSLASVEPTDAWSRDLLAAMQPTRIANAGTLQYAPPTWLQDHRAPLRSLLLHRFPQAPVR